MTPSQILLTVKACVLLTLLGFVYWLGGQGARTDLAEYRTKVMASTAKAAQLATKASELARKAEHDKAIELAAIALQHLKDTSNAKREADRVAAGLESGAIELRKHWAGCETSRLSDPAARAAELAGQDQLRRESLRRVLGWVGELQAQRDGLQRVVEADRQP